MSAVAQHHSQTLADTQPLCHHRPLLEGPRSTDRGRRSSPCPAPEIPLLLENLSTVISTWSLRKESHLAEKNLLDWFAVW